MVVKNSIKFNSHSERKSLEETKVPPIFGLPPDALDDKKPTSDFAIPIIDFAGVHKSREAVVEKIKAAAENWGIFQVINHGVPLSVLEEIQNGVVRFHEEDPEVKKSFFSLDLTKTFIYHNNFELYSSSAGNWRDSFFCYMDPDPSNPEDLPVACR